jgi:hypothetical protein
LVERLRGALGTLEAARKDAGALAAEAEKKNETMETADAAYEEAAEKYGEAALAADAAYEAYNERLAEADAAYKALEAARLERRVRREIADYGRSAYLGMEDGGLGAGYKTPAEKAAEAAHARNRAAASAQAIRAALASADGRSAGDGWAEAYEKYREADEGYYLGQAAAVEGAAAIARQEALTREAEASEEAARRALVSLYEAEEKDIPAHGLALASADGEITLAAAVEGTYEGMLSGGSAPALVWSGERLDRAAWLAYFDADAGTAVDEVGGVRMKSRAEADTEAWLERMAGKEAADGAYLERLMLAGLWMESLGSAEAKAEWGYSGTLERGASAHGLPGDMHNFDLNGAYLGGTREAARAAYEAVMADAEARGDLAKYLLYRETTLGSLRWREEAVRLAEIAGLERLAGRLDSAGNERRTAGAASVAAGAALVALIFKPWMIPIGVGLIVAGGTLLYQASALGEAETDARAALAGRETLEKSDESEAERLYREWRDALAERARQREALNVLYYGQKSKPEEGAAVSYEAFLAGLEKMLEGSVRVGYEEALKRYAREAFEASGAGAGGTVSGALSALNGLLEREKAAAWEGVGNAETRLREKQAGAAAEHARLVGKALEIPEEKAAELRRLAEASADGSLGAEERASARAAYAALAAEISVVSAAETAALEEAAGNAWGVGTWNGGAAHAALTAGELALADKRTAVGDGTEGYAAARNEAAIERMLSALEREQALELEVREAEWALLADDLEKQRLAWEAQASEIARLGQSEWRKALGGTAEGYNKWRKKFAGEYAERNAEWEANYGEFLAKKNEWITEQYIYAANLETAGSVSASGAEEAVAAALAEIEGMSRPEEGAAAAAAAELLAGTRLEALLETAGDLAGRGTGAAGTVRKGARRTSAAGALAAAEAVLRKGTEEARDAAAELAGQQAERTLAGIREGFRERLKSENEGMKEWEERMVLSAGYRLEGGTIARDAVIDSTIAGAERERQTVAVYEFFEAGEAVMSADLTRLDGLDAEAIMALVEQANRDMEAWSGRVFGETVYKENAGRTRQVYVPRTLKEADAAEYEARDSAGAAAAFEKAAAGAALSAEEEKLLETHAEMRAGEFGRHVGYAPAFRSGAGLDVSKGRDANVADAGLGEMGKILLDFQWNDMRRDAGYAELSKPMYDQKLWADNGWFEAPTLRSVADLALSMTGSPILGLRGRFDTRGTGRDAGLQVSRGGRPRARQKSRLRRRQRGSGKALQRLHRNRPRYRESHPGQLLQQRRAEQPDRGEFQRACGGGTEDGERGGAGNAERDAERRDKRRNVGRGRAGVVKRGVGQRLGRDVEKRAVGRGVVPHDQYAGTG